MSRRRLLLILIVASILFWLPLGSASMSGASRFSDVSGHWAEGQINDVASWGIVGGNPDGSFLPDGLLSRAAFVKMVVGAAGIEPCTSDRPAFPDTRDHWVFSQGYIEAAVQAGIVEVAEYGSSFGPDQPITREEMAAMAVRAARDVPLDTPLAAYPDMDGATPSRREYIETAGCMGLMGGYPDGFFRPKGSATRAEAVVVIGRLMGKIPGRLLAVRGKTGPASSDETPVASLELLKEREGALSVAEKALAAGVRLTDPAGDWAYLGTLDDNPEPYHLDCVDLRSLELAMDAEYLYVKIVVGGPIAAASADYPLDGDTLLGLGYNVSFDLDNNRMTGTPGNGAEAILTSGFTVAMDTGKLRDSRYCMTGPTGSDREDEAFEKRFIMEPHEYARIWGGIGYDYILTAVPLSVIGVLPDQAIAVSVWAEAGTGKYHHGAFDCFSANPSIKDPSDARSTVRLTPR